ncbi:glycosyltransferase family 2 protein [Agromyces archimandritae]|uniref:Glycosyltransferase family 2 protein n=1 Tax=Agromyces archimandritae TaxID=2781962 RepID=A0A975FP34_9MICO|nr:glycosyltransferase family 2 protein [Agromyces archimandritae]QTX05429.1 glycosyltransferase family 2 protein [Agromyces archimandritae]
MSGKLPITVLVQTKSEAASIGDCVDALTDFDEVIVVDSLSEDGTADIARRHGARVVDFDWDGRYPKKKQWQLENVETRNEWVLMLDADESPTPELVDALRREFSSGPVHDAYDVRLSYVFAGRELRYGHRVVKRCLLRRGRARFDPVDDLEATGAGEVEGHYQPRVDGSIGSVSGRLTHHDRDPVGKWFERHNRYSDWEAHLRIRPGTRAAVASSRSRQGRIFDRIPFKPAAFFVYDYVVRLGFLDGRAGLDYAIALSTYYWQIGLKVRELRRSIGG